MDKLGVVFIFSFIIITLFLLGIAIDIFLVIFKWESFKKELYKKNLQELPLTYREIFSFFVYSILIWIGTGYVRFLIRIYSGERIAQVIGYLLGTAGLYVLLLWFINRLLKIYGYNIKSLIEGRYGYRVRAPLVMVLLYIGFFPILLILSQIGVFITLLFRQQPHAHPLIGIFQKEQNIFLIVYLIITAVLIAPVFEEIVFRGIIYRTLKRYMGIFKAGIVSSIIFAGLHLNLAQFFPIFGIGFFFCMVYEITGSLPTTIFLHIVNNGFFLIMYYILSGVRLS